MDKLVFLDVDDTLLTAPHRPLEIVAGLMGIKNFPTEEEAATRSDVDHYKAFPEVFRSKNKMWAMALASIPFGFIKSQKLYTELNVKVLSEILSDSRVFLISQNPPIFSHWRIKHLENLTGAKVGDRYVPCGPILGKAIPKIDIIKTIAALYKVSLNQCLLIDDHPRNIAQASKEGIDCRLVDASWNRSVTEYQRLGRHKLCDEIVDFLGACQRESPPLKLHYIFPKATISNKLMPFLRKITHKFSFRYPLLMSSTHSIIEKSLALLLLSNPFKSNRWGLRASQPQGLRTIIWTPYGFSLPFNSVNIENNGKSSTDSASLDNGHLYSIYELIGVKWKRDLLVHTSAYSKQDLKEKIKLEVLKEGNEQDQKDFEEYAAEMLSSRSPLGVFAAHIFSSVVSRLVFRNVYLKNLISLKKLEQSHFVIYTPHHRSVYDSLLLFKVLGDLALTMPIIPAADKMRKNLVGWLGQFTGVFYIRRKGMGTFYFKMMNEVIKVAINSSPSTAVFLEGQRSRSGLSLSPKAGALKMIIGNALNYTKKPVVIVPISFAYNKLPEADLLLDEVYSELKAENKITVKNYSDMLIHKMTSSVGAKGLVRTLFKKRVSDAYVTFGEPIYLQKEISNSRQFDLGSILHKVMVQTNCIVPPIATSISCLAILSSKSGHLYVSDLVQYLSFASFIIKLYPGSVYRDIVSNNDTDFLVELNKLPFVNMKFKRFGINQQDVVSITDIDIITATHYRNNIIHYFAAPACLAKLVNKTGVGKLVDLQSMFLRSMDVIRTKYFITDSSDLRIYFDKLMVLFSLCGAVEIKEADYEYKKQTDGTPFAILCTIAEVINGQVGSSDLFQIHRGRERIELNIGVHIAIDGSHEFTPGKLKNISQSGGACESTLPAKIGQKITIYFGNNEDKTIYEGVVARVFVGGFGFQFTQSKQVRDEGEGAIRAKIA